MGDEIRGHADSENDEQHGENASFGGEGMNFAGSYGGDDDSGHVQGFNPCPAFE